MAEAKDKQARIPNTPKTKSPKANPKKKAGTENQTDADPVTASNTSPDAPEEAPETKPGDEKTEPPSSDAADADADANVDYEVVSPPPTVDPRRSSGLLVLVLLICVIGLGTYATWPIWSPYVAPQFPALEYKPAPDPRVSGLAGRLDALEAKTNGSLAQSATIKDMEKERARLQAEVGQLLQRLEAMERTIGGVKEMVVATGVREPAGETKRVLEEITARLSELEKTGQSYGALNERLDQLETETARDSDSTAEQVTIARSEISSMIGKLEDRLNTLESSRASKSTSQARASAIVLAVSQLRKSAVSGEPFDKDVDALKALSEDHIDMQAALLVLESNAKTGTPTIDQLREHFFGLAGTIIQADNVDAGNSWIESAVKRVQSLVTIRKRGTSPDTVTVDSLVVLIEDHLRNGDIAAAVKVAEELETVSAAAAQAAEPWLKAARTRLKTERAVASLHVYAVALVASEKN